MSGLRADECLAFAITFRHQPDCVALIARKASLALFVLALQEPLFTLEKRRWRFLFLLCKNHSSPRNDG